MSTTLMTARLGATHSRSDLTKQLEYEDGSLTPRSNRIRPLSEAPTKPTLSPSPAIRESPQRVSKDDFAVSLEPTTPSRPAYHMRGLSLQMPTKTEDGGSPVSRIPSSPKLEASSGYGSPASVLPRRSRGLDFARACTSLHQSTLAESSPDASPITGRGINIPQRRSNGGVMESPSQTPWTSSKGERTTLSSSVSSINMMDSDSDSDASSDLAMDRDVDDPMLNTPAASKINSLAMTNSPGMDWLNNNGPTSSQISLLNFQPHRMNFRRARLRDNKSPHSSSSVSMRSSKPSPGPLSPPIRPSVEGSGYFGLTKQQQQARSRRESLSLGTDELHLSDSEWDGDNRTNNFGAAGNDGHNERGVIRRAVTRRSNLLPKTKGFARIRAALMEESDPLHTEQRREAEVIKQVHESDAYDSKPGNILDLSTTEEPVEASIEPDLSQETSHDSSTSDVPPAEPFSSHAKRHSAGLGFWNTFEHTPPHSVERYRTPEPLQPQDSVQSDDAMTLSSTPFADHTGSLIRHLHRSRSRSTTPLASVAAAQALTNTHKTPQAVGLVRKRRRDDDFDPASFKRRAVSPSMASVQSSPIVPQSPTLGKDSVWGRPPSQKNAERSNSGGSVSGHGAGSGNGNGNGNGVKRVGLQGMTEANEGFGSMSID